MPDPGALPLRDIHLPEPIGWWPPAPGWWLVAALAAGLIVSLFLWRARRRRPLRLDRAARTAFSEIEARFAAHGDTQRLLRDLSILMRRICISLYPRHRAAALHGEAWLRFLDELGGTDRFTAGPGRALAFGPYQPRPQVDPDGLLDACRCVLDALKRKPREAAA